MDFFTLAQSRFSVRKFQATPVPADILNKILEAGRVAPTACNNQPQKIIVVQSPAGLERLKKCTSSHFNAPLALIVGYDKTQCWRRSYDGKLSGEVDASIVATHMMLQAAELGIGSTWVMHFIPQAIKQEFSIPDTMEPVAILVMGYPAPDCPIPTQHQNKKNISQTVSYQ